MAEVKKVTLVELDIKSDAAIKAEKDTMKAIEDLKKSIKDLEAAEEDNTEAIIEKNAQLRVAKKELRENKKFTEEIIKSEKANKGSIEQLRRELSAVTIEWKKLSKEERINSDRGKALTKQKLALTNQLKKEEQATGDARRNVGNYSESIQQAAGSLGVFGGASGKAVSGIQSIGTAFKVALGPIGLILAAIGFVVKAIQSFFTSSEEGQDKLRRLQAVFQTVFGNLSDILSEIGEKIIAIFENPKQAIEDFGKFLKERVTNILEGYLELIPNLGRAFVKLFKGEFREAGKIAGDALGKVAFGVENVTDKIGDAVEATRELIAEQEREIAIAQALADRQSELNRTRRAASIQLAKNRSEIQDLLLITRDATKSFDEQREAIIKANQIREDELVLKEQIAAENLDLIKSQNELSNSTIEDLDKEAQAEVELFNLRAENAAQRRELSNRLNELDNRIRADRIKKEKKELERQRKDAQITAEILKDIADNRKREEDEAKQARMIDFENELQINQDNIFKLLELERQKLESQRQQEIEFAEKIGADVTLINEKYRRANEAIAQAEFDAKLSLVGGFAANVATIFGEQTAIGKAAAIAQTTIATYEGATKAYSALAGIPVIGPGLGIAAAGAAIAAGLANVKKILAVNSGLPGGGGTKATIPPISGGGGGGGGFTNINPSIGQGIASRGDIQAQAVQESISDIDLEPTLIVDEVTAKQNQQTENNTTRNI
jgi:hypothetical protein